MNVSAIIVTRGDVDMQPVIDALVCFDEVLIWDNSVRQNLSVYGRYAMIEEARNEIIWTQDDDVIVSNPQAIVEAWHMARCFGEGIDSEGRDLLVANMPSEFRHDGYTDSCLVGFGACFHRDLPRQCFERFLAADIPASVMSYDNDEPSEILARTCDVVFTTLAPRRVLVDVPKTDREFASAPNRMWKQPDHYGERVRMLDLARQARDA